MSDNTTASVDVSVLTTALDEVSGHFVEGLHARYLAWLDAPSDLGSLQASLAAASTSGILLCAQILLIVGLVAGMFFSVSRLANRANAVSSGWRTFLYRLAGAVAALATGLLAAHFLAVSSLPLRTLRFWTAATIAACVLLFVLRAVVMAKIRPEFRNRPTHLAAQSRDLTYAIDVMYTPMLDKMGGKQAAKVAAKVMQAQMKSQRVSFISWKAQRPYTYIPAKTRRFAIVRYDAVFENDGQRLKVRGYLLGIKSPATTWQFVNGDDLDSETFTQYFPDFPKTVKLPRPEAVRL